MTEIRVTEADVLARRWFAVPDDTVGGWACATVDLPISEIDQRNTGERVAVDCWGEATARHLADLHNACLSGRIAWVRFGDSEPIKVENVVLSTPPEVSLSTPSGVGPVDGMAMSAMLSALPDASLTLSGKFNSAAEEERDQLKEAIIAAYEEAKDAEDASSLFDIIRCLSDLVTPED